MALIFYLSSLSKPPSPGLGWVNVDKLYHVLEYAALGFLVARALLNTSLKMPLNSPWTFALLFTILYAASDEWHQSFVPGRLASIGDWIADSLGCGLGVLAVYIWSRRVKWAR